MKWWDTVFLFIYIYTWRWLNIYECLFIACDGTILRFPMWFHPVRTCCYCSGCWVQILPTIWLWEWYLVLKCFEWFWYSLLLSTIVAIASWATGEWQGATSRSRPVQCYIPWIQYIYIYLHTVDYTSPTIYFAVVFWIVFKNLDLHKYILKIYIYICVCVRVTYVHRNRNAYPREKYIH